MAKSMNRSLYNIFFVGYAAPKGEAQEVSGEVKPISAEDSFLILESASSVLVVPGYGMAVAQAQHVVKELGDLLEENGCEINFGIHPVAGRMPGHMNVLLADANVPYDNLLEPKDINPKKYTMNNDPEQKEKIGLLAQEVEKVFPEIVNTSDKYLSINYQALIPILINAVNEQTKRNESLKQRMETLKSKIKWKNYLHF